MPDSPAATLIISVYDNTRFLKCVLDSLMFQTDKRFEVIISEDAEHAEMKDFIQSYKHNWPVYHLTQPDYGWQKNRALNRASVSANTNHLIFIDGDCVLHPRFVEFHIKMFHEDYVLAGKRIKLDSETSGLLLDNKLKVTDIQKYILKNYFLIKKQGAAFIEEGLFLNPNSILGKLAGFRKMDKLKGCNMSFSKKALYAINGFDEDYTLPAVGEDADLAWRFGGLGFKLKSLRNLAVQYHLYHAESWTDQSVNLRLMQEKQEKQQYVCMNGLSKNNRSKA